MTPNRAIFSLLLFCFVAFSCSIVIPMYDVLCLDTQHIQQQICKFFFSLVVNFCLITNYKLQKANAHTHTVSDTRNSHGHTCTHAHKDFSRFTRPNHLYLFSKITSWTNFFSHTLSFLFFSLLLVCCCCYCWWCE